MKLFAALLLAAVAGITTTATSARAGSYTSKPHAASYKPHYKPHYKSHYKPHYKPYYRKYGK